MIGNKPSKKKTHFLIQETLKEYLDENDRYRKLPVRYADLTRFDHAQPLLDLNGKDTHWKTVIFRQSEQDELNDSLTRIYALLKNDGEYDLLEHLSVARIDFCEFGNTQPFRIRIINKLNDNYDHFYVKKADASRIYGLELEHLLSPNKILYLVENNTLIEEHIIGIPGDEFIDKNLTDLSRFNQIRISKEFIKFNERCFVRLLGDMRAYNYVVEVTPDIEGEQFRIRAIDFDQQSYEGRRNFYLPQYFKENNPIIFLGIKHLSDETVRQYQHEERSMTAARIKNSGQRLNALMRVMKKDRISSDEKVRKLAQDLGNHHGTAAFTICNTMGEIVETNVTLLMQKVFRQSYSR